MNTLPEKPHAKGVLEVLTLVREHSPLLETESVPLTEALQRTLRESVGAVEDHPQFDRSAMDGYAVLQQDSSSRFRVVDNIRAGDWKPRSLQFGEAVRIATGGALPGAGLRVVMKEDASVQEGFIQIQRCDPALNIRFRGEDARRGQVLIDTGTLLQPGSLALLASLGHIQPTVTRLPRVLHVVTGNEIVPPEQTPGQGQIRDSNSTLVHSFLNPFDIRPRQVRVPENRSQVISILRDPQYGIELVDILLVSGGASVGEHDFTRELFETLGYKTHLCKTNIRPGKPLIFATRGTALAFGLPGNPLAHFVCLNLYVRAALEKMSGWPERNVFGPAILDSDLNADGNSRETLWPASVHAHPGQTKVRPLRWSSSGDLTCLATANGLLHLPAGCQKMTAGSVIQLAMTNFSLCQTD